MITGRNGEDSRRYLTRWVGDQFDSGTVKELPLNFFGSQNGYTRQEGADISELAVGETWVSPSFGESHTVCRIV